MCVPELWLWYCSRHAKVDLCEIILKKMNGDRGLAVFLREAGFARNVAQLNRQCFFSLNENL